jgi:class 3 adenylate cyclase/tetratricopeptide (TPR) repeat protein
MKCSACGTQNAPGMKFCGQCGSKLAVACPACGFQNPEANRFCGQCGGALPTAAPKAEPTAERRLLTVLFCDLVGSTELAGTLELDALREVVRRYQATCSEPIERYGGHIAQLLGDGLLVYFGYPRAHEDDAQRAIHAALGILQSMERLNEEMGADLGTRLDVRIAIHTGPVVAGEVGAGGRRETLALGQTPNIAARLQSLVQPGTVAVSDDTHRLTQGFFEFESLGEHQLKGIAGSVTLYRPLRATGVRSRFELTAQSGLVPMVGRGIELAALTQAFEATRTGKGRVVLVTGEAGIGKSRLLHEFLQSDVGSTRIRLLGRCSPYHHMSAFYPVIDMVRDAFGIASDESPDAQLDKLEASLADLGMPQVPNVPLLAGFLSIPLGARYQPLGLIPHKEKERQIEALISIVLRLSNTKPVVIVVEDMHWADPSTLELLGLIGRRWSSAPILTVVTARPGSSSPWGVLPNLTVLTLDRLSEEDTSALIERRAAGRIPAAVLKDVIARTDGIPLFIEELTEMVSERVSSAAAIPTSIQAALTERLDRSDRAKELAQIGSVFGREFTQEMVRAVSSLGDETLQDELGELVEANLLIQRGVGARVTYAFRHALIRDAAYESMVAAVRQRHHRSAAQYLAEVAPELGESQPELVAHHWTEGAKPDVAAPLWLKAGHRAVMRSANIEAIDHLNRGLAIVAGLPAGPMRDQFELGFQTLMGPALSAIRGYAAPEVQAAYERALQLCRAVGQTQGLFWIMRGLAAYYFVQSNNTRAQEVGAELLPLANPANVSEVMDAHYTVGLVETFKGDFASGRAHLEHAISLDSPDRDRSSMFLTGLDVGVISCCIAAMPAWAMGDRDQALAHARKAVELAQAINHPLSLACALYHLALIHVFRGEREAAREQAGETIVLAAELGFFFDNLAEVLLGWAQDDDATPSVDRLRRMDDAFQRYLATGARAAHTCFLSLLAEGCLRRGDAAAARLYLQEALAAADETGEHYWDAELHRLMGDAALLDAKQSDEQARDTSDYGVTRGEHRDTEQIEPRLAAERSYRRGIEISRAQGAFSLTLRSALGLARLLGERGRPDEARAVLDPALAAVREGRDLGDATAARELLASLPNPSRPTPSREASSHTPPPTP